jgi:group I intron endonuclease
MADVKWSVYKHTSPSGKIYIGITSRQCEGRWANGKGYRNNKHFYAAILKYGWENFKHEILATDLSKTEAQSLEIIMIMKHRSNHPLFGYNNSAGGEGKNGFVPTVETRNKIRMKLKGRHRPDDVRTKLSISHTGKHLSDEHKEKIRNSCKNINGKAVMCVTTGVSYPSASDAALKTGISRSGITACCRGETASCKQTVWKYIEGGVVNG